MTNAEYYKNCSFDELLNKFMEDYPDEDKQTVQNFYKWRNAEHCQLIIGDAVINMVNNNIINKLIVEIVVDVNTSKSLIKLRPIAAYLTNDPRFDTLCLIENLKLYTGKPLFNVNELSKDLTMHYHFVATPSCLLNKSSNLTDSAHTQTIKSKKDKILDYMEQVMLINSYYINELRKMSVKEICTRPVCETAYIFNVLYRVSPHKYNTLTKHSLVDFMSICKQIAPKWFEMRQKCKGYDFMLHNELMTMLKNWNSWLCK